MPRLIWVFAGRTGHFVGFVVWHLISREQHNLAQYIVSFAGVWQLHSKLGRAKRIWYLSPMRAAKVQASLRIRAVSPEPPLLAHTSIESRGTVRQKTRSLALLNVWACAVKICHDGLLKDTNSLDGAQLSVGCIFNVIFSLSKSCIMAAFTYPHRTRPNSLSWQRIWPASSVLSSPVQLINGMGHVKLINGMGPGIDRKTINISNLSINLSVSLQIIN